LISLVLLLITIIRKKTESEIYAIMMMSVPILTTTIGIIISELMNPIFNSRYVFPAMSLLFLGFAIAMKNLNRINIFILSCFFCFTIAVQYQGTYFQEYRSTKVVETENFFDANLKNEDLIIFNFTGFGFIYEHYWPDNELIYLGDMDFSRDFTTAWYLDTYNHLYLDDSILTQNCLRKDFIGDFGIEHDEFKLYKITKNE